MTGMNADVRDAVKAVLEQRGLTQAELARRIGMERPNLHRLLSGRSGQVPEAWQKIFDELGLQLIAIPLNGDIDLAAYRAEQQTIDESVESLLSEFPVDLHKQLRGHLRRSVEMARRHEKSLQASEKSAVPKQDA